MLLALTLAAVAASVGWGMAVERFGPMRTLLAVLGSWCVGLVIAGSVISVPTFLAAGLLPDPVPYGVIVSTLLDAGSGDAAYRAGILGFLLTMLIGVVLLPGVPEPPREDAPG